MTSLYQYNNQAVIMPVAKNETTAVNEAHCNAPKPKIPCPLVHPPDHLVPKPTKKPPPSNTAH